MFFKAHIKQHERGLWFRDGDFIKLLAPGKHWNLRGIWFGNDELQIVDTLKTRFEHPLLEVLAGHAQIRGELEIVDLADNQRAIVWKDDRVLSILGPGRHAFWKAPAKIAVEVFAIEAFRFVHAKLPAILAQNDAAKWFDGVMVNDHEDVLLYRDGVLIERLGAGLHVFWKGTGKTAWKAVDKRELVADVAGQEIMTADKVTLRVNLVVAYTVADVVKATTVASDYNQALYREAQLVLREAVGTRTLDTLLGDKQKVGDDVRDALITRAEALGLSVKSVGIRDIILPGDMKLLLNQVIAATKEAEANLIRRREETAAARSQVNTAKLLAENPLLARVKELEMLKEVLAGTKATFIFGQGDLTEQIKTLVAAPD